jgi:hypothetical protein
MTDKPVLVTVKGNSESSFKYYCLEYVNLGYVLSSSNCYSYGWNGVIDEVWQAVFVLPDYVVIKHDRKETL